MASLTIVTTAIACGRIGFDGGTGGDGPSSDLVAHFTFDTDFLDHVGGLAGDCAGASCPTRGPGVHGTAAVFDGGGDCLVVQDAAKLHLITFTVAAWAKHELTRNDSIVAKLFGLPANNRNSWQIEIGDGGAFPAHSVVYTSPADSLASSPGRLPLDAWHHVAITFDGGTKRIYVDGTMELSASGTVQYDNGAMTIGCDQNLDNQQYLGGSVDDLRIYSRALSAAELTAIQ